MMSVCVWLLSVSSRRDIATTTQKYCMLPSMLQRAKSSQRNFERLSKNSYASTLVRNYVGAMPPSTGEKSYNRFWMLSNEFQCIQTRLHYILVWVLHALPHIYLRLALFITYLIVFLYFTTLQIFCISAHNQYYRTMYHVLLYKKQTSCVVN